MKILHIAESIKGGVATYINEIGPYQTDRYGDGNVYFLIPEADTDYLPSTQAKQLIAFKGKRRSPITMLRFMFSALLNIYQIKPDIIHLHSTFAGALVRLPFLCLPKPCKFIYCAHGYAFLMDISDWKKKLYAVIEKILAWRTDVIINISHHEGFEAIKAGLPKDKLVTITNGLSPLPSTVQTAGLERGDIKLLFVGRFDRQKGFDILLDLFRKLEGLSSLHLYVAGGSVLEGQDLSDIPENVTLLGWLPGAQLASYYKAVDALIVPSRWEGFGLVAVEAMRAEKAVIASNRGALAEIVLHKKTGLIFNPDKSLELENILITLRKEDLAVYGKAGKKRFLDLYTAERLNKELTDLYDKQMR